MIPEKHDQPPQQVRLIAWVIGISFALFIVSILCLNSFIRKEKELADRMYPNVYLDGIDIGGRTKEDALALFTDANTQIQNTITTVLYQQNPVATFSATDINLHINITDMVDRDFLVPRTPRTSSRLYQKLTTLFHLVRYDFYTEIDYDAQPFTDTVSNLEDQYNIPAKNALFSFENGKVSSFRQDEKGLKINRTEFLEQTKKTMQGLKTKQENLFIAVTDAIIEPEITLQKSNSFGIEELIGEGKSNYTHSIPERVHNIIVATSRFHGVLIPKGTTFSFDQVIGDISAQTGYQPAYVIKNGRTVLGDGGGVCQVSTTFFRAALNAGLPIVERNAHAYRVSYYENDSQPGLDATIFAPSVDLRVINDTTTDILIQTEIDKSNNLLYFRFYGKKDGRTSQLSDFKLTDQSGPPPPLYQDDVTLKKGVVKQVDFPAWGGKASFLYTVKRDGQELIKQTFTSVYRPWQAVYLVGQAD